MTLTALKSRAAAWRAANKALETAIAADEGDMNEQQVAWSAELLEETASIRAELSKLGFGFLFNEAGETAKPLTVA